MPTHPTRMPARFAARVNSAALNQAMGFYRWSYADLARIAGVSKGTIGNLASGTRKHTTPATAAKIAKALNTDTKHLFMLEALPGASTPTIRAAA